MEMLKALWSYRAFIFGSVGREFQSKYRNSLLGAGWAIINPLAMIIVYTVVFSQLMSAKLPGISDKFVYSIYLCTGLLTWGFFANVVLRMQSVFLENANLLKKVNFPRVTLPAIVVFSEGVNLIIVFGLFFCVLWAIGYWPGLVVFAVIPVFLIQLLVGVGLGLILGVLNVFFRDVGQFFTIFMQFWFWLTPIVYPINIIPEGVREFILLNPMYYLIAGYQNIFVMKEWPNWATLVYPSVLGLVLCYTGTKLFRSRSGELVDEL